MRGDEAGEQHVAASRRRETGSTCGATRAVAPRLAALAQAREAAALVRDQHVARAELGDVLEREREVLPLVELLADERLGLALVRRDEERLRLEAEPQRLALRVEHGQHLAPVELADQLGVEVVVDAARQRAGEDDEVGAAGEVVQLLEQHLAARPARRAAPTR